MQILTATYVAYLGISTAMTLWVARTLFRHGRPFLVDAFAGDAELADSVNHLLVVGFYLVNLGWVCLSMTSRSAPLGVADSLELLSVKIGWVLLVLGAMHFLNLYLIARLRRSGLIDRLLPARDPAVSAS